MKNRIFIYLLTLIACLFYLSIPDVASGQTAQQVFDNHRQAFRHVDAKHFFPEVLEGFRQTDLSLNSDVIKNIVVNPRDLRIYVPEVEDFKIDSIIMLLTLEQSFITLFISPDFHAVLQNSTQNLELQRLIREQEEDNLIGNPFCPQSEYEDLRVTLLIDDGNGQVEDIGTELFPFVVTLSDQSEDLSGKKVNFEIIEGSGNFLSTMAKTATETTDTDGQASTTLKLGNDSGMIHVEASFGEGADKVSVTFFAYAKQPEVLPPTPMDLKIISGNNQTGESGMPLAQPFIVGVLDQNGKALKGAPVTFRVITKGDGSFSTDEAVTDVYGRASVEFTLGSDVGVNLVRATLRTGTLTTKTVTFSAVAKSDALPVVYWIEDDALYEFKGHGPKKSLVKVVAGWTATSLTVDIAGNKIYWTERQDGKQKGRIRSKFLSGRNVTTLKELNAVPNGIVANPVNGRLYWTNSRGKIQSIQFNGSGFEGGFIDFTKLNMPLPKHIALVVGEDIASGEIYWTASDDQDWSIWRSSLSGTGKTKVLDLGGLNKLSGLAVARDNLYWAEETDDGQGKIRSASVTGAGEQKALHVLEGGIPSGIAVDAAGSRLYWTSSNGTNFSGSIQRLNLDAPIQIVVENLTNPTGIVLGAAPGLSVPASPTAPTALSESSAQNVLLANYPNPFNPETWIPYQLSKPADVSVSIYSVNGHLIRTLALGHQSAGVYRNRSRAAYWDGRNELGERVASGLYFYTLTAGDFTATRKMLIRK